MLSKDEFILWHVLHRMSDEITRYEENIFSKTGITHQQYQILLRIALFEEINATSAKITDIVFVENRSFVSISLITDRMVRNGLIKKVHDRADLRIVRIKITRKGKQILKEASKPTTKLVNTIFGTYSSEEKKMCLSFMTKILDTLGRDYRLNEHNLDTSVGLLNKLSKH
jgi:DNA-binding MarR family transcriptional regulator